MKRTTKVAGRGSEALAEADDAERVPAMRFHRPDARECAMLVLRIVMSKQLGGPEVTRLRLTELSLKRMWARQRLTPELLLDVGDWLLGAGFALFFAGSTYALVKISVVENWARVSSKRLADEISKTQQGRADFSDLEHMFFGGAKVADDS